MARKVLERKYAKVNELKRQKREKETQNTNLDAGTDVSKLIIGNIGTKKKTKMPLKVVNDHTTTFVIESNIKPEIEQVQEPLKRVEDNPILNEYPKKRLSKVKNHPKKAGTRIFSLFWGLIKITY